MSNTDSFIDEVNEEVRRDRLYGYLRKYGWIGALAIALIVGGASWIEWNKAQERASAQALGDALISALSQGDPDSRAAAARAVQTDSAEGAAVTGLLSAAELAGMGDFAAASEQLELVAANGDVPEIYRQLAGFKSLLVQVGATDADTLRQSFGNYAIAGNPFRLLAEEQLALLDAQDGQTDSALARLQAILTDAEANPDLQDRAMQVIVALGGEPDMSVLSQTE